MIHRLAKSGIRISEALLSILHSLPTHLLLLLIFPHHLTQRGDVVRPGICILSRILEDAVGIFLDVSRANGKRARV